MTSPPLQVRLYTPESPLAHPAKLLREMLSDLWAGRELAWRLAVRDISAQYRQSALGVLWALIIPLANTAVWLFLTGIKVVQVAATSVPYPVFVFTGTLLWSILIDAFNAPLVGTGIHPEFADAPNTTSGVLQGQLHKRDWGPSP